MILDIILDIIRGRVIFVLGGLEFTAGFRCFPGTSIVKRALPKVSPGGKTMSNPTTSIDIDRDIGNFFYDLKPTRDAGVGLTEQTIDYIVDVKGEPDWIREFRKNAYQRLQEQTAADPLGRRRAQGNRLRPDPLLPRFWRGDKAELGRRSRGD